MIPEVTIKISFVQETGQGMGAQVQFPVTVMDIPPPELIPEPEAALIPPPGGDGGGGMTSEIDFAPPELPELGSEEVLTPPVGAEARLPGDDP